MTTVIRGKQNRLRVTRINAENELRCTFSSVGMRVFHDPFA
jgi:hypothetical protein